MSMMQIKKKVYIPVFFCCEGLSVYLQQKKTRKEEEGFRAIWAIKYKKYIWQENCSHTMFGVKGHKLNIQVKKWHKQLV